MPITRNQQTTFNDFYLNLPERHFDPALDSNGSLGVKLDAVTKDTRPIKFTSPVYQPLNPEQLIIVHTTNSPSTGGFQGNTRSGGAKPHGGIDIKAEIGTGVLATEDGVVVRSEYSTSYGNVVYINHRGGYQTRYAHLSELQVKEGDEVKQGELIGTSGKTGNASGDDVLSHLHFEIRDLKNNRTLDPIPYLVESNGFHFDIPQKDGQSWKFSV